MQGKTICQKPLGQSCRHTIWDTADFFGGSVVEAIYCGCYPLMPNGLAFPDHVPKEESWVLYDSYEELLAKTRQMILTVEANQQRSFQDWVKGYDWKAIIEWYDQAFEGLCSRFPLHNSG